LSIVTRHIQLSSFILIRIVTLLTWVVLECLSSVAKLDVHISTTVRKENNNSW
jgi:hypothetical protein